MADSYYRTIKGKQYDRGLLEIVEKASKRSKAPLTKNIAKSLFSAIVDGGDYTDVEKRTVKYIRDNFNFSADADEYLRTEIRKWAAKISVPAAKKKTKSSAKSSPKTKKKTKSENTSTISRLDDTDEQEETYFHVYETENEETKEEIEPTPEYHELVELNRYGKKNSSSNYIRYVFIGIFIVILICIFLIFRSCHKNSSGSDSQKDSQIKSESSKFTANSEQDKSKTAKREMLLPHTEIGQGTASVEFKKRSEAIRYINDLKIGFIKQTLNAAPGTADQLATLGTALKSFPEIKIRVKGHTCFVGELDENKILSEERAKLIKDELIKLGVKGEQLDVRGFGETTNIDTNYTEAGRIKNRRVDFSVLSID